MFFQIVEVAQIIHPRVIFLENVANLIDHDDGKTFITMFNSLSGLNYVLCYRNMPSNEYGNTPQTRNRTYIYIPETKTIVEIKSVLSSKDEAVFPTVYSERTQNQLKSIQEMLDNGYKVAFIIVSLNPYIKKLTIDKDTEFYAELTRCVEKG